MTDRTTVPVSHLTDDEVAGLIRRVRVLPQLSRPLADSLRQSVSLEEREPVRAAVERLAQEAEQGRDVSASLASLLAGRVIKPEDAGRLQAAADPLAILEEGTRHEQNLAAHRRRLSRSLAYPSLIMTILIGLLLVDSLLVTPRFREIYLDFGIDLPVITRFTLAVSDLMVRGGWVVILAAMAAVHVMIWSGSIGWGQWLPGTGWSNRALTDATLLRATARQLRLGSSLKEAEQGAMLAAGLPPLASYPRAENGNEAGDLAEWNASDRSLLAGLLESAATVAGQQAGFRIEFIVRFIAVAVFIIVLFSILMTRMAHFLPLVKLLSALS